MRHNNIKKLCIILILIFSCCAPLLAQQDQSLLISGTVKNEYGEGISGVSVVSDNREYKTVSNANGEFSLAIGNKCKALTFSQIGFVTGAVEISEDKVNYNIRLDFDNHNLSEVIDLGYTSQQRKAISGSVATVSGEELKKSPVANLTQSFPGRLSGLFTEETYSELSRATTDVFVRGLSTAREAGPLVMIDGIINAYKSSQTLEYITPDEIESVTVLKDASTEALYGIQGANGLIVITTKRGTNGKLQIDTRIDQSFQQVTTQPSFFNAGEYAELMNQAAFSDGLGENYYYSSEQTDMYRSGSNPNLYPNNNWYNKYMKDFALMQRVGVNLTGGNEKVNFYSNVNMMHQGGQFITDQSEYNPNTNNVWLNFRSNIDMDLTSFLKGYVRLSGNIKRERTPGSETASVYNSIFQIPSNVYGPVTPEIIDEDTGEVLVPGGKVVTTQNVGNPTYGMLNRSGYWRHTVTNINSQIGFDLDMAFLTRGLSLSGVFAYQTNSVGHLSTSQDYERWVRTDNPDELMFELKGANNDTPLAYGKSSSYYYHLTGKASLNYTRTFGKHHVSGMGYAFYQDLTKADVSSPYCLPYKRFNTGFEATYGYNDKYFVKFDMGYSGSEQYARDNRFTFTPAVSGAWLASGEDFLNDLSWLSLLKLRASYGKAANDQSGLARYAYADNVSVRGGGPLAYLQYLVDENEVGNPGIKAEVSEKQNYGIDLGLFNALTFSVDVFRERMDNMVVGSSSIIPLFQGIPLGNYPKTNTGVFENNGYDISIDFRKHINKDLSLNLNVMYSMAKNKIIFWNEATKTEDYAYRKWEEGFSFGQEFGYLVDYSNGNGFFNSEDEITGSNRTYSFGTPRVGDLKYQDLNSDNIIDERDKAPLGDGAIPRIMYAFSGGVNYKSFELSCLFQGVGKYATVYGGMGVWETSYDGVFGALHRNAWTQERYANGDMITYPALSRSKSVNHEVNDFFLYDRSYLRLKNLEFAYSLPESVTKIISAESARIILSGQNLITWDNIKSDDFGPEGSYGELPVYRVYNIGISILF